MLTDSHWKIWRLRCWTQQCRIVVNCIMFIPKLSKILTLNFAMCTFLSTPEEKICTSNSSNNTHTVSSSRFCSSHFLIYLCISPKPCVPSSSPVSVRQSRKPERLQCINWTINNQINKDIFQTHHYQVITYCQERVQRPHWGNWERETQSRPRCSPGPLDNNMNNSHKIK